MWNACKGMGKNKRENPSIEKGELSFIIFLHTGKEAISGVNPNFFIKAKSLKTLIFHQSPKP